MISLITKFPEYICEYLNGQINVPVLKALNNEEVNRPFVYSYCNSYDTHNKRTFTADIIVRLASYHERTTSDDMEILEEITNLLNDTESFGDFLMNLPEEERNFTIHKFKVTNGELNIEADDGTIQHDLIVRLALITNT